MSPSPSPAGPPGALPTAVIRRAPEDFVVEEIPAYAASGRGEHVFVTFRKTGITTPDAVRMLARALGADPRAAGYAGMKDRHAVTTQTASFQLPIGRDPEPLLAAAELPGIEVLAVARHDNKLKPGHLVGNRFRVVLRDVDAGTTGAAEAACARLREAGLLGVPNAFGPQRFGRDGDNPERALAWVSGKERGPRDKREQRLLFSALQSRWFNEVLAAREDDGSWCEVRPGDLAKKHDTGGLFGVPLEGPELREAEARARAGAISATGPMFGRKMRWPEGGPGALERAVLARAVDDPRRLDAFAHAGEGTRRPLRMMVEDLQVTAGLPDDERAISATFVLPKGGYATTLLGRAFRLLDAAARPRAPGNVEGKLEGVLEGMLEGSLEGSPEGTLERAPEDAEPDGEEVDGSSG